MLAATSGWSEGDAVSLPALNQIAPASSHLCLRSLSPIHCSRLCPVPLVPASPCSLDPTYLQLGRAAGITDSGNGGVTFRSSMAAILRVLQQ
ncbi:hypothetical protein GOP47_0026506 [Adiantum capillus-veneris]|nr:hypothetical protein GOP47_0026506 [Adiantum capillus-veneris]